MKLKREGKGDPGRRLGWRQVVARLRKRRVLVRLVPLAFLLSLLSLLALYLHVRDRAVLHSPNPTPLFEDRHGAFLAEDDEGPVGFWDLPEALPQRVAKCLIEIEDRRFLDHHGVDWRALARAFLNNLSGGERQGASTIAMQIARLQDPAERGYFNKLREIATARLLVHRYGHDALLRHYLKIMPQGNRMHGAAYSARRYFRKPVQDLGWAEAALLAALPKAPGRMNLFRESGRRAAWSRAQLILRLLHARGGLDDEQYQAAVRQLADLKIPVRETRPFNAVHAILRLTRVFSEMEEGFSQPIRTSLDLDLQNRVDDIAHRAIEAYRAMGAGNISVIVAGRNGEILAYLGSDWYADESYAGAIDFAATPRSPGSTLKPFIYALGLMTEDFSPASVLADLPFNVIYGGGHYSIRNYDGDYLGPLLYRKALANSRNIPAVRVLNVVGIEEAYAFLGEIGLSDPLKPATWYGLGMAIGGVYVTLEQLVGAYGVLANDGKAFELRWWSPGLSPGGPTDRGPSDRGPSDRNSDQQRIPEAVARQISGFLSDPLARMPSFPRASALEYPFAVAVKTGTSQGDRDAWCLAYSDRYLVGVWIGHPDHLRMKGINGLAAARVVHEVMMILHPDQNRGVGEHPFPPPRGFRATKICPLSGGRVKSLCGATALEYFQPGSEPALACQVHQRIAIDRRHGGPADQHTPAVMVETRDLAVLAPEYGDWGARHGYERPGFSSASPGKARVAIQSPSHGSRLAFDPDTPAAFQSLALKVEVSPAVPEIDWYVDGQLFCRAVEPYSVRWPLVAGTHQFQARFPRANVSSEVVTVHIAP